MAAGIFSGFLYSSAIFSIAFLLPVQVVYGRQGKRAGMSAAALALCVAVLGQALSILRGGNTVVFADASIGLYLLGVLPPAVLLLSLSLLNAGFWKGKARSLDVFAATLLLALAALPGLISLARDSGFIGFYEQKLGEYLDAFLAQAGPGVDPAPLRSAFDVKTVAQTSITILYCSYSAILMVWIAGSRWLGNRISGAGSLGRKEAGSLADYRLPYLFVWPFLVAWTGVLGVSYFKPGMPWQAVAWNLALVLSLAYAVQGLGIASHLMRRWNLPKPLRICLAATAVILFVTPPAGPAFAGLVPLLGVTEVWIPYRNPQGVKV